MKISIPISQEQEAVITEHALYDKPMTMYKDERQWMAAWVAKTHPGKIIKSAHLNIAEGVWELDVLP